MRGKNLVVRLVLAMALLSGISLTVFGGNPASAATTTLPKPPAGYVVTYSRNFTTQGIGDWIPCSASCGGHYGTATAKTVISKRFGLGIDVTGQDQWGEEESSKAVIGPNTFVQALVYIPPAKGNVAANWPGLWSYHVPGDNWPKDGEIDILEGLYGNVCATTHWGPSVAGEKSKGGGCKSHMTGWMTLSMLRTGGKVKVWYNNTFTGNAMPMPPTAVQELILQNQSYDPASSCPTCYGPYAAGTAWISRVKVYSPKAKG